MTRHTQILALIVLLNLIAAGWPLAAPTLAAAQPLTALPTALSETLQLGASTTVAVQISNSGTAPAEAAIYEANPTGPPLLQQARPADLARVTLPRQSARVDPAIFSAQASSRAGTSPVIVYLADQADLSPAYAVADWAARGALVYTLLRDHAERSQRGLRTLLRARGMPFEPLWIVNAVVTSADAADIQALSAQPEIALLQADERLPAPVVPPVLPGELASVSGCNSDQPDSTSCWNIRKIGAERVWHELGVRGEGITVASIDTGVAFSHPALLASYRGYRGALPPVNDYNWYDPSGTFAAPGDDSGHGTHTMGTMVGGGSSADQPGIGVAPGARWIAARGCSATFCDDSDLLRSAQWLLAPTDSTGANPRPDLRPMIINNSWGTASGRNVYSGYVAAWRAAGIFPVFANGNTGAGRPPRVCGLVLAPADYANVVGVGATDISDRAGSFSLYGPAIDSDGRQRLKPDFSAPGVGIVSATPAGDGYRMLSGTSMATPHVAGAVALIWSANPSLIGNYEATYSLLRDTALRISDTYCGDAPGDPNNIYGYGRIDAYAAVARARVDLPWLDPAAISVSVGAGNSATLSLTLDARRVPGPGVYSGRILVSSDLTQAPTEVPVTLTVTPAPSQATLSGRLHDSQTALPIVGQVKVAGGPGVATDAAGAYTMTLAQGSYTLLATALGHFSSIAAVTLSADTSQSFALAPDLAQIAVPTETLPISVGLRTSNSVTLTLRNTGTQPLVYDASAINSFFSVARSDEEGPAYSWVDLPPGAVDLTAQLVSGGTSDAIKLPFLLRFFNKSFSDIYVGNDGFLSFDPPGLGPQGACLPFSGQPAALIALFKTDLDLSRGGSVHYAALGTDTWVVSYEHVHLTGGGGERYSFQAILHASGQITLQYGALGPLPEALVIGAQSDTTQAQTLGCRRQVALASEQAITLRPQPDSSTWLLLKGRSGTVAPGQAAAVGLEAFPLDLSLSGACGRDELLTATLAIASNDLSHGNLAVPLAVTRQSPPHCLYLGSMRR